MKTLEEINQSAQEVFDILRPRVTDKEIALVQDAYSFAREAHDGQMRKGGDPYIVHPIAVARIVAEELELGANAVCAAFLHDVVEDTPHTIEEICNRFGDDVAFLVDVVTKRKKEHYAHSKQVDNYKQILDSVHYDIRALMVKLADRLNNMRTLESMSASKQMKIAGETDFFYAPLANRLGLYRVRSELENLSFKYRCPHEYMILAQLLEKDKQQTLEDVAEFVHELEDILQRKRIKARVEVRYRQPYSIWRDMCSEKVDFANVEFKHYIRVIYETQDGWSEKDTSLYIYSALTDRFKERTGSVTNYIDNPKSNGYQSFHVKLLGGHGKWEEMHISSERMLRISRLGCIEKTNAENLNQWLAKLRVVLQEMAEQDLNDFMEGVSSSFYSDDMFVYTPQGKVILLPKGATALDFAFELHTEIGMHAQYARINGKLSPMRIELQRGDCVEIHTHQDIIPNIEWLEYVNTYKAKHTLKYLTRQPANNQMHVCSSCHPLPGDEIIGFKQSDGHVWVHKRNCPKAIKLASERGDDIVETTFDVSDTLYPVRLQIVAIDRYHLLHDIIDCFAKQHLSMHRLITECSDYIVTCTIDFKVHSAQDLNIMIDSISAIENVDIVQRMDKL